MQNSNNTHISGLLCTINYDATQKFFNERAATFCEETPYISTSYQDGNPRLATDRDAHEKATVFPLLGLTAQSRVLVVGCGVGRWADSITAVANTYLGLDFSKPLLDLAKKRVSDSLCETKFQQFAFQNFATAKYSDFVIAPPFSCVLISGILAYINDLDLEKSLVKLADFMGKSSVLYVREPIGIERRLTLLEHFSLELQAKYSAIYRTKYEYDSLFNDIFIHSGFWISAQGKMLPPHFENRKDTTQYYWIFKR